VQIDKSQVLILIPAFNEENTITKVIGELQSFGYHQIVVVDDGSADNSGRRAREAGAKVLRHCVNRGSGAATKTGFFYALNQKTPITITIDADDQHDASDIDSLVEAIENQGADLAVGSRFLVSTNKIPVSRRIFNRVANSLTYLFCGKYSTDSQSGIKALNYKALSVIKINLDGFGFCSEIIISAFKNKLKVVEVPVKVIYTKASIEKGQGMFTGIKTALHLFQNFLLKD
jgi:glycosyltransferase involved in cell wall biosynthesis